MPKEDTQFKAGEAPGRPKGSKNRFTQLKQDILEAYQELGGKDWLKDIAKDKRTARDFLRLLGQLLPKGISIDIGMFFDTSEMAQTMQEVTAPGLYNRLAGNDGGNGDGNDGDGAGNGGDGEG